MATKRTFNIGGKKRTYTIKTTIPSRKKEKDSKSDNNKSSSSRKSSGSGSSGGRSSFEIEKSRLEALKPGTQAYETSLRRIAKLKGEKYEDLAPVRAEKAYSQARADFEKGNTGERFQQNVRELNRLGVKPEFSRQSESERRAIIEKTARDQIDKLAGSSFDEGVKNIRSVDSGDAIETRAIQRDKLSSAGSAGITGPASFIRDTDRNVKNPPKIVKKFQEEREGVPEITNIRREPNVFGVDRLRGDVSGRFGVTKSVDLVEDDKGFSIIASGSPFGILSPAKGVQAASVLDKASKASKVVKSGKGGKVLRTLDVIRKPVTTAAKSGAPFLKVGLKSRVGRFGLGVGNVVVTTGVTTGVGLGAERVTRPEFEDFNQKDVVSAVEKAEKVTTRQLKGEGVIDKASNVGLSLLNEVPFTGDPRMFEQSLKATGREKGLKGEELDRFVSAAKRYNLFREGTLTGSFLASSAATESFGRSQLISAGIRNPLKGTVTNIGKKAFLRGASIIGPVGAVEGVTQEGARQIIKRDFSIENIALAGSFGAVSAGLLGGGIVGTGARESVGKSKNPRKVLTAVGNLLDPFEAPGDIIEKGVRKGSLFVRGGTSKVPIVSFNPSTGAVATSVKEKKVKPIGKRVKFKIGVLSQTQTDTKGKQTSRSSVSSLVNVQAPSLETILSNPLSSPSTSITGTQTPVPKPSVSLPSISITAEPIDNSKPVPAETVTQTQTSSTSVNVGTFTPQPRVLSPFLPPLFPKTSRGKVSRGKRGKVVNELSLAFGFLRTGRNGVGKGSKFKVGVKQSDKFLRTGRNNVGKGNKLKVGVPKVRAKQSDKQRDLRKKLDRLIIG